jgi:hypothetical protein
MNVIHVVDNVARVIDAVTGKTVSYDLSNQNDITTMNNIPTTANVTITTYLYEIKPASKYMIYIPSIEGTFISIIDTSSSQNLATTGTAQNAASPNVTGSTPNVTGSTPNVTGSTPNVTGSTPNVTGSTPNVTGSNPNVTVPTPYLGKEISSSLGPAAPVVTGVTSSLGPAAPVVTGVTSSLGPADPVVTGSTASLGPNSSVVTGVTSSFGPAAPDVTGVTSSVGPAAPDVTGVTSSVGPAAPDVTGVTYSVGPAAPDVTRSTASFGPNYSVGPAAPLVTGVTSSVGPAGSIAVSEYDVLNNRTIEYLFRYRSGLRTHCPKLMLILENWYNSNVKISSKYKNKSVTFNNMDNDGVKGSTWTLLTQLIDTSIPPEDVYTVIPNGSDFGNYEDQLKNTGDVDGSKTYNIKQGKEGETLKETLDKYAREYNMY